MKAKRLIPTAIFSIAILFTACKKEDIQTEKDANPREFKVNMTDAPGDYEALTVEIEGIEVYHEGSGWISLSNDVQYVNVLDLTNGVETQLAIQQEAEIGVYSKLKIKFGDDHKLTLKNTTELGGIFTTATLLLDLSLGGPDEIVIDINEEISAEQGVDLLVDFNVAQSIIKIGEAYILKPAIAEIKDRSTGINGEVKGAASAAIILTNGSDSISAYTNTEGNFLLRGMDPGTYDMYVYPKGEENTEPMEAKKVEGVVVKEGKIKSAGTIRF